ADHLLTIVPSHTSVEADRAFAAACEFVSALGWEHGSQAAVWESGGRGWLDGQSLRTATPTIFTFPRVAFGGNTVNYDLHPLPTGRLPQRDRSQQAQARQGRAESRRSRRTQPIREKYVGCAGFRPALHSYPPGLD